ncbi:MAG: hypothetical protein HPY70_11500 [Firmicutes bacterium]|nr:hypothetical protein [Bacillota bacterium]
MQQERIKNGEPVEKKVIVSVDEKPGCQVLKNTADDRLPVPGKYPGMSRDHAYIRLGTVSLLSGIDLQTGIIHGLVREKHRSKEFIELLKKIDNYYPTDRVIKIICDNHSAHISKETRAYLKEHPGRFVFIFTPKHASWLNIIGILFCKMGPEACFVESEQIQ